MVFSSLIFLYAFFPACLLCYMFCRTLRSKNICLLAFSLVFYAWGEPVYVLLLLAMAFFDWFFALRIQRERRTARRKRWLILSVIVNLGLLGFFKYSGMICSLFGPPPELIRNLALPIGISFYTFQLLTYVVTVYRAEAPAERSYARVLLYAALFHQCIAGPIVRYKEISRELFYRRGAGYQAGEGVLRFSEGLAKKVLLANPLGELADRFLLTDAVIADPQLLADSLRQLRNTSALGLWIGLIAFALQIYFDFSGYSDMAVGMGKMLGLHYPENFDHPYVSRSVTEFWRRWHITLGSFFRDYVYFPLGGSRKGAGRTVLNLLIVWALTGLWHGASWNFVLWGLYWFVFAVLERLLHTKAARLPRGLCIVGSHVYLLLVTLLGWVLFKYTDLRLGWTVLRGLFAANGSALADFTAVTQGKSHVFLLLFSALAATPVFRCLGTWVKNRFPNAPWRRGLSYGLLPTILLLLSTAALVGNSYNPFLYFQF